VKMPRCDARIRFSAVLAVALVTLPGSLAGSLAGSPAAGHRPRPHPATAPQLTISVSDGRLSVRQGQTLTYLIRLRNTGTGKAARLSVTQTLSAGLQAISASGSGRLHGTIASWDASVPANASRVFRVAARVARPPAQALRLAAVACAARHGSSQPIVCAADLDLFAGRTAAAGPARRPGPGMLPFVATAFVLLAGGAAAICLRRTRHRRTHASRMSAERAGSAPEISTPSATDACHRETA